MYDDKFTALEAKIKEYEALAAAGEPLEAAGPGPGPPPEALSDDSEDRLSTIDESEVWERQVRAAGLCARAPASTGPLSNGSLFTTGHGFGGRGQSSSEEARSSQ